MVCICEVLGQQVVQSQPILTGQVWEEVRPCISPCKFLCGSMGGCRLLVSQCLYK